MNRFPWCESSTHSAVSPQNLVWGRSYGCAQVMMSLNQFCGCELFVWALWTSAHSLCLSRSAFSFIHSSLTLMTQSILGVLSAFWCAINSRLWVHLWTKVKNSQQKQLRRSAEGSVCLWKSLFYQIKGKYSSGESVLSLFVCIYGNIFILIIV